MCAICTSVWLFVHLPLALCKSTRISNLVQYAVRCQNVYTTIQTIKVLEGDHAKQRMRINRLKGKMEKTRSVAAVASKELKEFVEKYY